MKHYFQMQIDMQDVNQVLASHFNDFGQKVIEAYIRPLKIKDSVPKYRVPIQSVLRSWAEDDALLLAMANAALQDKRGDSVEKCRADLLRKIFWIDERYDNMEHDYLDEIDAQVRRYTRAATQKVENLTNRDQNVRGNLNTLLTALSRNRGAPAIWWTQIQPVFQLYEQSFLSEKQLVVPEASRANGQRLRRCLSRRPNSDAACRRTGRAAAAL
ncbi:MAG: Wadjet anti-phage system protein JetA family protein [Oscillospiraceae bacterium]